MFRSKVLRPLVFGVGIAALQLLSASSAFAYAVSITANAVCTDGVATINYTATSFEQTVRGQNTQVNILFNGSVVDSQPFLLPTNSFSGSETTLLTGTVTVTADAVGVWGDGEANSRRTASTTVSVPTDCVEVGAFGRFTGGPNGVDVAGVKVTTGLQIHCHPKDPSINFEINWGGGQNFHLDDVTTVTCFDDPLETPKPPRAPVDTIVATGTGKFNGTAGYTIVFTLVDSGEPDNKRADRMAILITAPNGTVVLNVPMQFISAGNIQAHFDQPHGPNK